MSLPQRSTLYLTHFGRRSGKPFRVKIWYANLDGELWIGSLDATRSWVRNLTANRRGRVDFGSGPVECGAERMEDSRDIARYREAVAAKYPIVSRILALVVRNKKLAVFRLHIEPNESARPGERPAGGNAT